MKPSRLPRFPGLLNKPENTQDDKENHFVVPLDRKRKLSRTEIVMDSFSVNKSPRRLGTSITNADKSPRRLGNSITNTVNSPSRPSAPTAPTASGNSDYRLESGYIDVEALLSVRMTGKSKFDFKGKCEQQGDYIKRLRSCIRSYQEVEKEHISKTEMLQSEIQKEITLHEQTVHGLKRKQDQLEFEMSGLQSSCKEVENKLLRTEAEKKVLLQNSRRDAEALQSAKEEKRQLEVELAKAKADLLANTQQVEVLQGVNARLQEYNTSLQQYNTRLQADASTAGESLIRVQQERAAVMEELANLKGQHTAMCAQVKASEERSEELARQKVALLEELQRLKVGIVRISDERDSKQAELRQVAAENAAYREVTGKSAADLEQISSKAQALQESFLSQGEIVGSLRQQLEVQRQKTLLSEEMADKLRKEADQASAQCEELEKRIVDAERRLIEGELLRCKLHNTIQELKGNIRVFCRVRPLSITNGEEADAAQPTVQYPASEESSGHGVELVSAAGQRHAFNFDRVFGPETQQGDVFVEISQLVQSALDGYRVCIFAYGQTGSGKTHTMLGVSEPKSLQGMIPRSLEQIFASSQAMSKQGWQFSMQASMLEIYNETIRDLLIGNGNTVRNFTGAAGNFATPEAASSAKQYTIKHDQNGNTTVTDLSVIEVASWNEVSSLLAKATHSRSVGKTAVNERSSRSHFVFTLRIDGVNKSTAQRVNGVLNLIDLAGSERLSRSGATGDRLKETQAINKSLSSLGDVISALANKEQHIPFRNSKLTYLLQPCLGGNSKTLVFVNIAPEQVSLNESLCSLRFAAKVNACEIGVPKRNIRVDQ